MTLLEQASELMQPHGKMMWLIVLDHQGSSPGKRGFQMFVSEDSMTGTIGGGIMEHKLVEYARSFLKNSSFKPVLKRQIHQPEASNSSG